VRWEGGGGWAEEESEKESEGVREQFFTKQCPLLMMLRSVCPNVGSNSDAPVSGSGSKGPSIASRNGEGPGCVNTTVLLSYRQQGGTKGRGTGKEKRQNETRDGGLVKDSDKQWTDH
jgi:hypothetical protein